MCFAMDGSVSSSKAPVIARIPPSDNTGNRYASRKCVFENVAIAAGKPLVGQAQSTESVVNVRVDTRVVEHEIGF